MEIIINGEKEVLNKEEVSITDLLILKEVKMPEMVTVEYNGEILERDQFEKTIVKTGDTLEFLYFMGGGSN